MKTILLIVNPISGAKKSKKILEDVQTKLTNHNINFEVIETEYKGLIEKITKNYNLQTINYICVIGGDGSFHEAINGLMLREDKLKKPLGIIPAGSGNSLSRDLKILNPLDAITSIINGKITTMDIGKISSSNNTTIYSFNIIGWGMVANIGIKAENYRWLGTSRYTILSLFEILSKNTSFAKITYYDKNDNKHCIENELMFAAICNTIHTGKGMKIAPYAKLNDGLMDLVLIKNASRFKLLLLMSKLFNGTYIENDLVEYIQIKKIVLESKNITKLNVDGEIKGITPFELSVMHNEIELINNY